MMRKVVFAFLALSFLCPAVKIFWAADALAQEAGAVYPLAITSLREYPKLHPAVQRLLRIACNLTQRGLRYQYGSANPTNGGMDCSGFVNYVLQAAGVKNVPRQANLFYAWVRELGLFRAVLSTSRTTFELREMQPGDLMFWTGTYSINRDPPVTHVMIYAGTDSEGHRWMLGASEGRYALGKARSGVSAFEFTQPGFPPPQRFTNGSSRFVGYAPIPGLLQTGDSEAAKPSTAENAALEKTKPAASSAPLKPAVETPAPASPDPDAAAKEKGADQAPAGEPAATNAVSSSSSAQAPVAATNALEGFSQEKAKTGSPEPGSVTNHN